MPKFSVVIPCYNRADLVAKAVASVLAQTYADFEIIVVDDGSTDQTSQVLAGFGSKITALRQENAGPGAARNLGVSRATGQYIAFLDSDDLWFPWTLAVFDRAIVEHNQPALLVGSAFSFRDESECLSPLSPVIGGEGRGEGPSTVEPPIVKTPHSLERPSPQPSPLNTGERESVRKPQCRAFSDYLASSRQRIPAGTGYAAIRADALRGVGGLVERPINYEDIDLLLRLGDAPGFVQIETPPTFALREHPVSLKANHDKTYNGMLLLIDREKSGQYPGGPRCKWERRNIITTHVRVMTLALLRDGRAKQAMNIYVRTFTWHLGMGRWRYLLGFACLWLASLRPWRRRQRS